MCRAARGLQAALPGRGEENAEHGHGMGASLGVGTRQRQGPGLDAHCPQQAWRPPVKKHPAPAKEQNQSGCHSITWDRAKGSVSFWGSAQTVALFKDPAQGPGRRLL